MAGGYGTVREETKKECGISCILFFPTLIGGGWGGRGDTPYCIGPRRSPQELVNGEIYEDRLSWEFHSLVYALRHLLRAAVNRDV